MISKRAELENYAQNVLRPNLCRAQEQYIKHTFLCLTSFLIMFVCIWICIHTNKSLLLLSFSFLWYIPYYFCYHRGLYWRKTEKDIRECINQIMIELNKPGEPSKGPNNFTVTIVDSVFDWKEFTSTLRDIFKKEPLLVFPNPVDASELV